MRIILIAFCIASLSSCGKHAEKYSEWSLVLRQPGKADVEVTNLPIDLSKAFTIQKDIEQIHVEFELKPAKDYTIFLAKATTQDKASVYFSLQNRYNTSLPYNFNGEVKTPEIYHQSPHDVNAWITEKIAKQAIPVVALKCDSGFMVALNGSPYLYDNFTSQAFYTNTKIVELSSGDNGDSPGLKPDTVKQLDMDYNTEKGQIMAPGKIVSHCHSITPAKPHVFEGIIFQSKAQNLNGLRKDINQKAAIHFSNGEYSDYFGALSFTTAYMNLRVNETGKSNYWVVPSVEYSNTQYCRDAFWISTMLSPEMSAECLSNELTSVNNYAEYPLFAIIWAYRAKTNNQIINLKEVQQYVDAVERRSKNSYFYSFLESDGRLDFQYWGDVMAFDKDDVLTYNQGLFALAIKLAREMGLKTKTNPDQALLNYQNLFNTEFGFYPISKKKNMVLGPDPLVPDLLSQVYFGKPMLSTETVKQHYEKMVGKSKTRYGFKTVCLPDGNYLPSSLYDVEGYMSQLNREKVPDGEYFRGGSFFLYDNLFLIDAYLHGIKEAEQQLIWRVSIDFKIGNTTYECLNTKTGNPWKPNMGWNVAIYSIWRKIVDEGKADNKLFKSVNSVSEIQ